MIIIIITLITTSSSSFKSPKVLQDIYRLWQIGITIPSQLFFELSLSVPSAPSSWSISHYPVFHFLSVYPTSPDWPVSLIYYNYLVSSILSVLPASRLFSDIPLGYHYLRQVPVLVTHCVLALFVTILLYVLHLQLSALSPTILIMINISKSSHSPPLFHCNRNSLTALRLMSYTHHVMLKLIFYFVFSEITFLMIWTVRILMPVCVRVSPLLASADKLKINCRKLFPKQIKLGRCQIFDLLIIGDWLFPFWPKLRRLVFV